tara:strand:- start:1023 stop:1331 length:309 start_codon:yes stop_codon:yes gene_type:complete
VSFIFLPNLKIISGITSTGGDIFDNPVASAFSTFEYSGWGGTVPNPITSSDFSVYQNSATASYEYPGWGGTVANPITSSDFSVYQNSATASYEYPSWETGSA